MRARKVTPVDIVYDRDSPIVVYVGVIMVECLTFAPYGENLLALRQREIQSLKYRRTSAFICRRSLGYNLKWMTVWTKTNPESPQEF
jgi:hypothetical protein